MLLEIRELEDDPIDFAEQFAPGVIEFLPDVTQKSPLQASGRAQLVEEHHGKRQIIQDIRLAGELKTTVELPCARCLEPVVEKIDRQFDLLYRPLGVDAGKKRCR